MLELRGIAAGPGSEPRDRTNASRPSAAPVTAVRVAQLVGHSFVHKRLIASWTEAARRTLCCAAARKLHPRERKPAPAQQSDHRPDTGTCQGRRAKSRNDRERADPHRGRSHPACRGRPSRADLGRDHRPLCVDAHPRVGRNSTPLTMWRSIGVRRSDTRARSNRGSPMPLTAPPPEHLGSRAALRWSSCHSRSAAPGHRLDPGA
jgi:hypothetical protein